MQVMIGEDPKEEINTLDNLEGAESHENKQKGQETQNGACDVDITRSSALQIMQSVNGVIVIRSGTLLVCVEVH